MKTEKKLIVSNHFKTLIPSIAIINNSKIFPTTMLVTLILSGKNKNLRFLVDILKNQIQKSTQKKIHLLTLQKNLQNFLKIESRFSFFLMQKELI